MWTDAEWYRDSKGVVYYGTVMKETIGVFKKGEKLDLNVEVTDVNGYYMLKEYDLYGNVVREQKVKLTACE